MSRAGPGCDAVKFILLSVILFIFENSLDTMDLRWGFL